MDPAAERLHRAIGRRVRELRGAEAGLSQEKLAARAGFHRTYVGKLERGEAASTVDGVAALCAALGVTLADFFAPFDQSVKVRGPRRRRSKDMV
jgi:transcriptional regulator with XRE-family HTH domain